MNKEVLKKIFLRNGVAKAAMVTLLFLYILALFAGFFSPYSPVTDEFREQFYHAPSSIRFENGHLVIHESSGSYPVHLFVHGWRYRTLGIFESDVHLFGCEGHPIFLLGSDQLGRDVFSRILFGAQISLSIGLVGVITTTVLGLFFGGIAGYYGGRIDDSVMRCSEVLMSIPGIYLILSIRNTIPIRLQETYDRLQQLGMETFAWQNNASTGIAGIAVVLLLLSYYNYRNKWRKGPLVVSLLIIGTIVCGSWLLGRVLHLLQTLLPGTTYVSTEWSYLILVLILSIVGWASMSRVVRGMVLSLRKEEHVLAAKALGASDTRILCHHIFPNLTGYVLARATLLIPAYVLAEVTLSFLGLGIQEPVPSWGNMISAAQDIRVLEQYSWILSPGIFLFITVLAFNFLGDALQEIINPRKSV